MRQNVEGQGEKHVSHSTLTLSVGGIGNRPGHQRRHSIHSILGIEQKLARANFRVIKLESFLEDRKQFACEIQFDNGSMENWPKVRFSIFCFCLAKVLAYDLDKAETR